MALPAAFVALNVGGTVFVTSKATLSILPDTMLARLVSDDESLPSARDSNGAIIIDRDPRYFPVVLGFLRTGKVSLDEGLSIEGVREEAEFFSISELSEVLAPQRLPDFPNRAAFILAKASTGGDMTGVRLVGMDLGSLNLDKAVLRNGVLDGVDFSKTMLADANLSGASVCGALFHSAAAKGMDARNMVAVRAVFDDADLVECNFSYSDLSGATFTGAKCERAMFQCAAVRGAVFSGAGLKQAKFQSSDLRDADLRGAMLEGARFTSSDLRGAKIDWATWDTNSCYHSLITEREYELIPLAADVKARMRLTVVGDDHANSSDSVPTVMGSQAGVVFVVTGTGTAGLKLRARANSSVVLAVVPEGTSVVTVGQVERARNFFWFKMEYNGQQGFMASLYLRRAAHQPGLLGLVLEGAGGAGAAAAAAAAVAGAGPAAAALAVAAPGGAPAPQ